MKVRRRALLALPALAAVWAPMLVAPHGGAQAAQAYDAPGSLCATGEVVIFHCGVGRKMVSVCGGRTPTPHAQYRFGTPGDIELAYPGPGQSPLTYGRTAYSGGGALQIRFANAGHDYVVYSRTVRTGFRGANNPRFSGGVLVRRGSRTLANRSCTTAVRADAQPEEFMAEGPLLDF